MSARIAMSWRTERNSCAAAPLTPFPRCGLLLRDVAFLMPVTALLLPASAFHPAVGPPTVAQLTALIDEMRNSDLSIRLNAFRSLPHIAQAMGTEKTRKQLIPYVSVLVENCDDDDEVLLLLASILGGMVDEVGGAEFAHALLQPLEQLTGADDAAVRNKAVESIGKLIAQMSEAHVTEYLMPLLRRMATAEWLTSRISASGLFHLVYPRVGDAARKELRSLFCALCRTEETPTVKRAATEHLGPFASVVEPKTVYDELFPVLQKLAKDEQDSVRLLTISACVAIAKIFAKDNKSLNVRPNNRPPGWPGRRGL